MDYFDKNGTLIDEETWESLHTWDNYRFVARTEVPGWLISTVWLGIDLGSTGEKMTSLFETAIFQVQKNRQKWYYYKNRQKWYYYRKRYPTEREAYDGHKQALQWLIENLDRLVPTELWKVNQSGCWAPPLTDARENPWRSCLPPSAVVGLTATERAKQRRET